MDGGKNAHPGLEANVATNGFTLQNETRGYQPELSGVELPPPYSVENQPQQQNVWSPQATNAGLYPPFHYPGGNQQAPFQYHPVAAPLRAGVLSEDEIRRRQETAIRHGIASAVITRRPAQGRRSCTYRLTRLGITLFLMGVILLIILGVLLVHPALNDIQLKSAQCTVISSDVTYQAKSCDCGRYCTSYYPCLEIQVTFHANGRKQTANLYENVYADKNKCSTQPCSSDEMSNDDDVESFRDDYGQRDSEYTCYYNPKTLDKVFTIRSSVKSDELTVMHCILWPLLLIAFSIGLLGTLFCRAKGHCCFRKRTGSTVPYQDLQPTA
ncbi:potassium large conductance calcium-activated channel, sub M, beta member 4 [Desmophyllum pertusum]|uniref:Potassium large conductance calcium-activated channel, sub M, beta member 4 n=1 Tax=Desmophyllum pertusum TaxID=174260 RepID=A0A9W9ZEF3_9CNID|nr:potassium large conductance calcium-activated channel, sub M, beta member 4 [Desmophyllum pertusum]